MFEDNEAVYLARYENSAAANEYLYEKYFHSLYLASLNYLKKYRYYDVFNNEEIKTMCYFNLVYAINRFDLFNNQYSFAQALFQINRSQLHNEILRYFNHNGNKVLNVSYSYDSSPENYGIVESTYSYNPEESMHQSIQYAELKRIAKRYIASLEDDEQIIMQAYFDGTKVADIVQTYHVERNYVQNLINQMMKKLSRMYRKVEL